MTMNCTEVRARLAEYLYADLDPGAQVALDHHLTSCDSCRREVKALQGVSRLLDSVPATTTSVDLPALYRELALRQTRRARRWKIAAAAVTAAAAVIAACAFGLRCEFRWEPQQLVIRWGAPPEARTQSPPLPETPKEPVPATETTALATADRNRLQTELIRAVADNMQALEQREQHDAGDLQTRLVAIEHENIRRFTALERAVDALYLMSHKGAD
jgi:hypothetical protein